MKLFKFHLKGSALLFITFITFGCGDSNLYTVKNEYEANQILDVLWSHNIPAYKENSKIDDISSWMIKVPEADLQGANQLMQDYCLGKPLPEDIHGSSIGSVEEIEKQREAQRKKLEIISSLRQLPGATCVDAIFVFPEKSNFKLQSNPASASVFIQFSSEEHVKNSEKIAHFVSKSIPNLSPENVEVTTVIKRPRELPLHKNTYKITKIIVSTGLSLLIVAVILVVVLIRKRLGIGADKPAESLTAQNLDKELLSSTQN